MSVVVAAAASAAVTVSVGGIAWPLRISSQGLYLEDQAGRPFQPIVDAGWEVVTQISTEDAVTYIENRRVKGFNAVEIRAIGKFQSGAPNNFYGAAPFTNGINDWSVRNETYWTKVDAVVSALKQRKMLAVMFPAYLGFNCLAAQGVCPNMTAQTNAAMSSYGAWIGARYAAPAYGNVLWMIGGDTDAVNTTNAQARCDNVVSGVRSGFSGALFSAEPANGQIAGIDSYTGNCDINGVYEYTSMQSKVQTAYQANKIFMLQEGRYENEHSTTSLSQIADMLITLLGGGLGGATFGCCPLWSFQAQAGFCDAATAPFNTWQNAMDSPGSVAVGNIGKLMRSRRWWKMVPDYANTVVTSAKGTGDTYHATAREAAGQTVMVWCGNTNQVTVAMTQISGSSAQAWWWNPATNAATSIGTFNTTGSQNFTPPAASRVLVIDDVAAALAAPGS